MRFVVCADPDGDEAVEGLAASCLAGELERRGHTCQVAVSPDSLPPMDEDDWLHVTGGLALHDSGSSKVLQVVGACPGAVSVDLFGCEDDQDALGGAGSVAAAGRSGRRSRVRAGGGRGSAVR